MAQRGRMWLCTVGILLALSSLMPQKCFSALFCCKILTLKHLCPGVDPPRKQLSNLPPPYQMNSCYIIKSFFPGDCDCWDVFKGEVPRSNV